MTQLEKQQLLNEQYCIILDREARLSKYDYIGVKIAMGVAKKSDQASQIAETQVWRADINAAQEEIARLEAIEVEEPEPEPMTEGEPETESMTEEESAEDEFLLPDDFDVWEEELSND